jgi:hypothetical protein
MKQSKTKQFSDETNGSAAPKRTKFLMFTFNPFQWFSVCHPEYEEPINPAFKVSLTAVLPMILQPRAISNLPRETNKEEENGWGCVPGKK